MTNEEIRRIALQQSAYDCNCRPEDFLSGESIVTSSRSDDRARKYLPLPFACDLVSYGNNIVAQTSEELAGAVGEYIRKYPTEHCLETPHLHALEEILRPHGLKICFMAEYFLPDVNALKELPCDYELRVLHQADFAELYLPEWSDALCEERKELDVLGVGAYDGKNWWVSRDAPPTVRKCIRSASMCCPNTGGMVSPRRLPAGWHWKF